MPGRQDTKSTEIDPCLLSLLCDQGRYEEAEALIDRHAERIEWELSERPQGWPDKCGNCGAHWSWIGFDYADGFNCRKCGAADSDE